MDITKIKTGLKTTGLNSTCSAVEMKMDLSGISEQIAKLLNGSTTNSNGKEMTFLEYISSPHFYLSVIVIAVAVCLWILLKKVSRHYNKKIAESDKDYKSASQRKTIAHIMTSVLKVVIILGALIAILQIQGFNVSSLVAGVGIIAAIIGFALQDAIKDVIGGMYILADHYFEVGDVISYNGDDGEVIRMSIRTTTIRSIENGNIITISNRSFSEAHKVSDWWDIDLGLSYDEDYEKIHSVLESVCKDIAKIRGISKCEYKGTDSFGESSIVYKIRCHCHPIKKYEMRRAALKVIQERLHMENINIPYNYLNVVLAQTEENKTENKTYRKSANKK